MSAAVAINHETAVIDRWIEPRLEPVRSCRNCGHTWDEHDSNGCFATIWEPRNETDRAVCFCRKFE